MLTIADNLRKLQIICNTGEISEIIDFFVKFNKNEENAKEFLHLYYDTGDKFTELFKHERFVIGIEYMGNDDYNDVNVFVVAICNKSTWDMGFMYIYIDADTDSEYWEKQE